MDKVRTVLRPIYKDFVAENIPTETPVISYEKLRSVRILKMVIPDSYRNISEQSCAKLWATILLNRK